jgi:metal-sulfur cluster biosynthetic enzyme
MSDPTPASDAIWQALATIPDPEFGINIVDLGLIYSVACDDGNVTVTMTLTTPTCPSGGWIHEGVRTVLQQLPGVKRLEVNLVFDPPWNTGMLSAAARRALGWQEKP